MARPRTFDADAALDAALRVFWAKGYRGASLEELTAVSGGSRPSLYAAFEDKAGLFAAAVERYVEQFLTPLMASLSEEPDGREALRSCLIATAAAVTDPSRPPGCLIAAHVAALEEKPGPAEEAPQRAIADADAAVHAILRNRLIRAKADGQLPAEEPIGPLTDHFHGVRQALSAAARSGRSERALRAAVEVAMRAWPV
jgi:AcrR family transcriptional regulator